MNEIGVAREDEQGAATGEDLLKLISFLTGVDDETDRFGRDDGGAVSTMTTSSSSLPSFTSPASVSLLFVVVDSCVVCGCRLRVARSCGLIHSFLNLGPCDVSASISSLRFVAERDVARLEVESGAEGVEDEPVWVDVDNVRADMVDATFLAESSTSFTRSDVRRAFEFEGVSDWIERFLATFNC